MTNEEKVEKRNKSKYRATKKWLAKNPQYIKEYREKNIETIRENAKRWARENPECSRENQLKRDYGITLQDYNLMLENQDFKCAICSLEKSENGRTFYVDHNHKTGKVRGLLCINCNSGIGNLRDSINLLTKAIKYLKNTDANE